MKKFISIMLAAIVFASCFSALAYADSPDSVTLSFLNYNVAGLPDFKALIGQGGKDVKANQTKLGSIFNESDFDVIAVQEDFNCHKYLVKGMDKFNYKTLTSGSVPGGDGLNIYTKNIKIYDSERVEWNSCYGGIAEGDALTPKGILYSVLDLGNGMTVDFYDIHADAFDGVGNSLSRAEQYVQLLAMVNKRSANRPVIITGDFNTSIHYLTKGEDGTDEALLFKMITDYGFKNAWHEIKNNGDYENYSEWYKTGSSWGRWDSVEQFYYRSAAGVEITAEDFNYIDFFDDNGANLSDHSAANCIFKFTKTADFVEDARTHKEPLAFSLSPFFSTIKWVIKDLAFIFRNWSELMELAGLKK